MIDSHLNLDPDDLATQMAIGNPPMKKNASEERKHFSLGLRAEFN